MMPTLSTQAQTIITTFGQQPGVAQDQVNNLQSIINNSPALIDQVNNAVAQGHLTQIVPLTNPNAGGEYDGQNKAMRLPLASLSTPAVGPFQAGNPAFVLGHELQHGFNHAATKQAYQDFRQEITQKAQETTFPHDYTAATSKLIAANRRDEAGSEIAGWNAVVGMVKNSNPNATLKDVYDTSPFRMSDFIDRGGTAPNYTYAMKPNLTLNADMSLTASPVNIEAMGKNYFDKPAVSPGGLGHHGNSDYANYYGAYAIGQAAQMERHYNPLQAGVTPQPIALNLTQLRLNEPLLEQNGINLGTNQQPMPYINTGVTPASQGHFNHTATTHTHVPIAARIDDINSITTTPSQTTQPTQSHTPSKSSGEETPDTTTPKKSSQLNHPSDSAHPFHAIFNQVTAHVNKEDEKLGRKPDEKSERLSMSATALAAENGITRIDHMTFNVENKERGLKAGENLIIVQGGFNDPAHQRANMKTEVAINTPVEQSLKQLDVVQQRQTQEAQTLALQQTQDPAKARGPSMG
jgi:hypothetical protein